MDILSLVIVTALSILITVTVVAVAYNIVRNLRVGESFRRDLAHKVDELRLGKMTRAMGIGMGSYLHKQPVVDIATQMRRCTACSNQDTCDDQLASGATIVHPEYCPNEAALSRVRDGDVHVPVVPPPTGQAIAA